MDQEYVINSPNKVHVTIFSSGNGKKGQQSGETLPNHAQESKGGQKNGQSGEKAGTSSVSGDPSSSGGPKGTARSRIMTEEPSSLSGNLRVILEMGKGINNENETFFKWIYEQMNGWVIVTGDSTSLQSPTAVASGGDSTYPHALPPEMKKQSENIQNLMLSRLSKTKTVSKGRKITLYVCVSYSQGNSARCDHLNK